MFDFSRRRLMSGILALGLTLAPVAASADDFVNILTGGTAGVYYPLGVAISKVLTDKVPGTRPSVQATKGSVENLNLIQGGKGEVGFTLGDSLAAAVAGLGRRRLQGAARQGADHRRDLSQLRADRRLRGERHQEPGRSQGQARVGRRAEIGHRAQRARDPRRPPA